MLVFSLPEFPATSMTGSFSPTNEVRDILQPLFLVQGLVMYHLAHPLQCPLLSNQMELIRLAEDI